jgi:hypothetical protein
MFDAYGKKFSGNLSTLKKFEDNTSKSELLRILDKEKVFRGRLSLDEFLNIAGVHIISVNELISRKLNRPITPYIHSSKYSDNPEGYQWNIFFFLGNNNWYTKYSRKYIVASHLDIVADEGIQRNDMNVYDVKLLEPLYELGNMFARARGMTCSSLNPPKDGATEGSIWYRK